MSTERAHAPGSARAAASARRAARRARDYRRTITATLGVLVVATAGLGVAGAFRAPHLDSASVAADAALERPGQRLVLRADQAIGPLDDNDVTITPNVPIEVESDGRTITVRFTGMLRALTDYTVDATVTGTATGVTGTLRHTFPTPDLEVAVLVRDPDGPDEVRRRAVSGDETVTVFSADRIQEFVETRDGIAAVVLEDSGVTGRLVLAPEGETLTQEVALPEPGRLQQLRASDSTGRVGFRFTSADDGAPDAVLSRLYLFDPLDPSGVLRAVTGLDGEPLSVLDWTFVPGTAYLVAQAFDQSLLLVDTADPEAVPVPLGEHSELRGFLPGTLRLVVADPLSGSTIDLQSGETAPLVLPDDGLDPTAYRGKIIALGEERYVEVVSRPTSDTGFVLDYEILLGSPDGAVTVFDPGPGIPIRDICLSPNAQYLAVETQDPAGEPDGYPNVSGRTLTTTTFVDLETGAANRALPGFASSWCG